LRDGSFISEVYDMDAGTQLARSHEISEKIARLARRRSDHANNELRQRVRAACGGEEGAVALMPSIVSAFNPWAAWQYAVDTLQRSILFWDTLCKRGDEYVELSAQGFKPVLHFDYEIVLDARKFERSVNYALLEIKPPQGVIVDAAKRPYVIIDPRAGHGPGIGGFKDDSQVGVALRAGHPVYFVVFFRDPEPGQTLLDVCAAEQKFVKKVRELHPGSPKPAIIGNCQGGWAAMMLASSDSDDTGPVVINGAPMSYWSGAWAEGEGDNPMRYAGGILGGTWLASLTADLGNGRFDGAHLVQNFENLNPANTFWDKYRHLYANIDTEPPRFLEFERWWGGYYLMNREEIEWITRNLFIGNKLWSGEVKGIGGKPFDLREIRSPIILFASMGDNITPPQQAFNWVADLYGSTEEIKSRGQVIVGLMHREIGHLGIFVSGKVAKKEHAQIVNVLQTIETLAPGLYGMSISDSKPKDGTVEYDVELRELRLEDVAARINRFERADEKPFEAVEEISEFNYRAYELFLQPFVQAMSNEMTARILREFHPLRAQRWAFSALNPWLAWLASAARAVKNNRKPLAPSHPLRKGEQSVSDLISASLDYFRATRDAWTESLFFNIYANMFSLYLADRHSDREKKQLTGADSRELPFVKEALASMEEGGYTEALARVAFLLSRKGEPLPLARLTLREELLKSYGDYVPKLPMDQWRRVRGEQEIIAVYEPERALETLPSLLADKRDRGRLLTLFDKLLGDERVQQDQPTPEQLTMLDRIRSVLVPKSARGEPSEALAQ
jgi:pimeloyl-ACP methyl ester carboxylesterase